MFDASKCAGCPLEGHETVDDMVCGDEPRYMIVTEAPARYLATQGRLLSNAAGRVLSATLKDNGFVRDDFVFVPQIRCIFEAETIHNKVKAQIQKHCRAHLLDAVDYYRPDVILPLGADAAKQVLGKPVKITKVRGIPTYNSDHESVVLPMLHPGYVAMYPQHTGAFNADCATFGRLVDAGLDIDAAAPATPSGYVFVDDLQFLVDAKPKILVFDTETTSLSYFHKGTHDVRKYDPSIHGKEFDPSAAILTMQFCIEPGTAYMLVWDHPERPISLRNKQRIRKQLVELLCNEDTLVVGHNCVTPDTEVLTPDGWINIAEYDGQEIMQWCPDTDNLSFVTPSEYHVHDYSGTMHEWDGQMFSGCFTPNHKMYVSKGRNKYDFRPAYAHSVGNVGANNTYVPLAGRYLPVSPIDVTEDEARLIEAVRADGSVHGGYIRFHFSKSRKVERAVRLLETLDMQYSLRVSKTGSTKLYVNQCPTAQKIIDLLGPDKTYGSWVLNLSISSRLALLDEIQFWDATPHQQSATGIGVYSASSNDMEWMQILAHTANHRLTYTGAPNDRGWSKDDGYIYTGTLNRRPIAKVQYPSRLVEYDGKVYCFTVPTGAFMVRRNGKVSITGNSKFDANFVYQCLGIRYRVGGDTLMLAALIDENAISKSQNVMVKQYVPSHAGYDDCIHPASRVLLENLTTKLAADIQVGDRLVGFEEMSGVNRSRQLTECVVEAVRHLRMVSVRIVMDSGESIQVSTNHQFLLGPKNERNGGSWKWRTAASLRVGDKLKLFPFPDEDTSYSAGWLSGILDGEGYACNASSTGLRVGFCQLDGPVLQKGISLFNGGENCVSWDKRKNLAHVTVSGARAMRELIRLRPVRLVNKKPWIGKALFTGPGTDSRIRSIEYVGVQEVVSIQTSSRTFITEGFASHNCFNATYDKGRMWEVPLDAMLQYGCGDVDTCLMLYDVFMDIVSRDSKLLAHYTYVSLPGINSFADIEVHGTHIDLDALRAFEQLMEEAVTEEYLNLLEQIPKSIKRKHIDRGLKFSRGEFTRDILFEHPDGFRLRPTVFTGSTAKLPEPLRVPSVSTKDHLPYFYEQCPFTLELAEYIKDDRILGTSVRGFKNKYIHDGLVRPTYSLWTAVTGRTSSESPNGQNYIKRGPRAKAYRKVFVAPEGYIVIEADYSQAELRIVADMANEPTMLRVYLEGGDIHVTTALIVLGISMEQFFLLSKDEQKAARQKAKAVNFGFVYGMGWRKFIGYAKTQYGVEFTEIEAQRIRAAYFELYAMLLPWHDAMRTYATQHGFVRSYSGRIRHLPMIHSQDNSVVQEAGRQAINSPVQGFASDLGIIAVSRMQDEIEPKYLQPIAFVHDALYCYAPIKYALWAAETLKYYMESNPLVDMFNRRMRVPIVADVSIGRSFGDTYELPGFSKAKDFDASTLWDAENETGLLLPTQVAPPRYGARITQRYGDMRQLLRAA